MERIDRHSQLRKATRGTLILLCGLLLSAPLTGCLMIGASSRGGFFIWPGGLGLLVLIVVLALVLRRR